MNIALFGTSGDPPTIGHQRILEWLSDRYDLVVVWVSNNPFKSHQTSLEDRIAMMRLLIAEIIAESDHPNLELHPEISNPYSLITVKQAQKIWQGAEFTLVIGGDLIEQIANWYQAEELLQQVKILVVDRRGYQISESHLTNLQIKGAKVAIADLVVPEISSTNYRKNGDQSGIIPSIAQYIYTNNLYQWEETNPNTP
ncbi:cytidyltransferase-related enzyme [Synechococcus sp. PCC 7502]|uniref:nicotinate-nucleotide adenylyltransferase n=1 Tax=Synechococcus sp. PCC 7502 TaxID=1173263 RepID=UPI00029FB005|nr:nicotinate-nucleotide adenylyltransferase [Synechococcus sp. PCC 7502]AFY73918.1 cytidyltransferase-related enzyme [Synechococcus sp. PCC 7502]